MAKFFLVTLALLLSVSTASTDAAPNPVQKVVKMLTDMQDQLKAEAKGDEEAYDKMQCYCRTNDAEKSKAISDGETKSAELTHAIEENTAKASTLSSEIDTLNAEIAANQDGLAKSTEIRNKERNEFNEMEKSSIVSIGSLKTAVMTLGQANDYSMLDQESLLSVRTALKKVSQKGMTHLQRRALDSLIKSKPATSFLQTGAKQPQSGAIFGILKQMKESFEDNLATAKKDEATAVSDYEALKSTKNEEIAAAQDKVTTKSGEQADAEEISANSKTDLAETQETLAADSEFLANLREMCSNLDKEFAERSKTRNMEIAAVSEAIGILTDDEAHDLFGKSLGFIQLSLRTRRVSGKELAARKIMAAGKKANDPKLILLASNMKTTLDAFGMVKEKVQAMIDDLKAQKAEEIKTKDQCNTDLHENGVATTARIGEKEDLENDVANLEQAKANLADEIAALNAAIGATHIDMKRASENRLAENTEFKTIVSEQRATQAILTKALDRLKEFYAKKAALVQTAHKSTQNPGSFTTYKKNESAGGVLAMIEKVVDDSKALEAEAITGEQDAQTAYETFISDSNASLDAMSKQIAQKTEESGTTDASLVTAQEDLKSAVTDIESLEGINKQLHWDCDFMLQNFDVRQTALDQEVEALESSIAMLSGANFR